MKARDLSPEEKAILKERFFNGYQINLKEGDYDRMANTLAGASIILEYRMRQAWLQIKGLFKK